MTEKQRDLHADLKLLTTIEPDEDEPVNHVHDIVAPHALKRAIAAEAEVNQLREENSKLIQALEWYRSEGMKGNSDLGHGATVTLSELKRSKEQ